MSPVPIRREGTNLQVVLFAALQPTASTPLGDPCRNPRRPAGPDCKTQRVVAACRLMPSGPVSSSQRAGRLLRFAASALPTSYTVHWIPRPSSSACREPWGQEAGCTAELGDPITRPCRLLLADRASADLAMGPGRRGEQDRPRAPEPGEAREPVSWRLLSMAW